MKSTASDFLPYLTSHQIDQMQDKDKAVVILPVASIEQHCPHSPVFTYSIIDFFIRDIREATSLLVFGLHMYLRITVPQSGLNEHEITCGIHAGDVETSMLLSCCPGLVHKDLALDGTPIFHKEQLVGAVGESGLTEEENMQLSGIGARAVDTD